ncbi:MAG: O-antigen ligase family protein [Gammaproteobacteria bacterium]|nr:O-antigen ligase family protein [Gammaproteobacteria bacterium]
MPIVQLKAGDIAVHISGILSFALVVLPHFYKRRPPIKWIIFWLFWFISFAIVGSKNRGGFLSILTVLLLLMFHINPLRWTRMMLIGFIFLAFFSIFSMMGVEIDVGKRNISITQMTDNVISILIPSQSTSLEGTKKWRLEWWRKIVNYTVYGPYFWSGKGFGINLADDDGFQVTDDHSLRSPHNGHLTILARMGVPGFALWLIMQIWFAAALWWNYLKRRWHGLYREAALFLWILTYWLAASVNAAFDVYLEGPQGGIWFWSIFGAGLGLMLAESRKEHARLIVSHSLPTAGR